MERFEFLQDNSPLFADLAKRISDNNKEAVEGFNTENNRYWLNLACGRMINPTTILSDGQVYKHDPKTDNYVRKEIFPTPVLDIDSLPECAPTIETVGVAVDHGLLFVYKKDKEPKAGIYVDERPAAKCKAVDALLISTRMNLYLAAHYIGEDKNNHLLYMYRYTYDPLQKSEVFVPEAKMSDKFSKFIGITRNKHNGYMALMFEESVNEVTLKDRICILKDLPDDPGADYY